LCKTLEAHLFVALVTAARMLFSIKKCSLITNVAPLSDAFVRYMYCLASCSRRACHIKKEREGEGGGARGKGIHRKSRVVQSCVLTLQVQNMKLTSAAPWLGPKAGGLQEHVRSRVRAALWSQSLCKAVSVPLP